MRLIIAILLCLGSTALLAIELDGETEFAERLAINSSISARVDEIKITVGQQVTAGDLLVTLVSTGLQANADIAQAEVNAMAPTVDRMLTELEKAQELFDRDSLAQVELQTAQQNHSIAAAKLAAAEAKLKQALFRLSQTRISSPIDGVVLGISTFPGQYINTRVSDQTLVTVAANASMLARSLLPLEQWKDSLMFTAATVSYQNQSFSGRIVEIGKQVITGSNNHPAMMLLVRFDAGGTLPAGLPVRISIGDE